MKITRTITIDGKTHEEYQAILSYLETEQAKVEGWVLHKEPLVNRVTAVNVQEVEKI